MDDVVFVDILSGSAQYTKEGEVSIVLRIHPAPLLFYSFDFYQAFLMFYYKHKFQFVIVKKEEERVVLGKYRHYI